MIFIKFSTKLIIFILYQELRCTLKIIGRCIEGFLATGGPTASIGLKLETFLSVTRLSVRCPYSDWEILPITPDTNCKILDTYLDIIRNMTVVTQNCGDIVSVNGSGYGQPFETKIVSDLIISL